MNRAATDTVELQSDDVALAERMKEGRDRIVGGSGKDRAKIDKRDQLRSVEKTSH